jgi:hypothetical protein
LDKLLGIIEIFVFANLLQLVQGGEKRAWLIGVRMALYHND